MKIAIPKEIKNHEYRVGATPGLVSLLTKEGHTVFVQTMAGHKIGFSDALYESAGAHIVPDAETIYREGELILKVKEPQSSEYPFLKQGQILFCFLHLAADPELLKHLIERKVIGISFDTVFDALGRLPILTPMSEVAGRLSIQAGATALQLNNGGKGILLSGVPGTLPAQVVILGGGVSGTQAAKVALGFGADVTILEKKLSRLRELDDLFGPKLKTLYSTPRTVEEAALSADLVIGAVLIPGKKAPKLLTEKIIQKMTPGSAFVDISIDQGGCSETSRPTTHSEPTYKVHNVVHYCVTNMPGATAKTSTQALTNAVAPYLLELVTKGYKKALMEDPGFRLGLNVCLGHVTSVPVAQDCSYPYTAPEKLLN